MAYSPIAGSLASKVVGNLRSFPSKRLRPAEISELFNTPKNNIAPCLLPAVNHGVLSRSQDEEGPFYVAGPNFHQTEIQSQEPEQPPSAPVKPATATPAPSAREWLLSNKIVITSDLPFPTKKPQKVVPLAELVLPQILAMKPGDSFSVPPYVWTSLRASIPKVLKENRIRLKSAPCPETQGNTRVWCEAAS